MLTITEECESVLGAWLEEAVFRRPPFVHRQGA